MIQEYKESRTEIKRIKDGFYKYEVAFVYNKEKKKTEKKTIRLLGKITETEGFVPFSKDELRRKSEELPKVDVPENEQHFVLMDSTHALKDIIEFSKAICKIKIRQVWYQAEVTQKSQKLFAKIGIDYLT